MDEGGGHLVDAVKDERVPEDGDGPGQRAVTDREQHREHVPVIRHGPGERGFLLHTAHKYKCTI